jgi:HSP20 family protein
MADTENGKQNAQSKDVARTSQPGRISRRWNDPFLTGSRDFFSANPFSLMRRMSEEMDRIFGDFGFGRGQSETGTWSPAIEVSERDGKYIIHAELPGLKPEEVKVELTDDALIIHGERKLQQEETKGGTYRSERRYGQFYRTIPLPEGVKSDQVRANFEHGVLEVQVPLPEQQSNRRQIPVQSGSSAPKETAH